MPMQEPPHGFLDALGVTLAKLGPGIAGSIVALRGLPPDTTWSQRLLAVIGGAAAAAYVSPALYEWTGATSVRVEGLLAFVVGAFSMVVIGEVTAAIRDLQLAPILRDAIRRFLRLDKG